MADGAKETWGGGEAYERFAGRWSRRVAREFLAWLNLGPGLAWGDVGCGTGALTQGILEGFDPARIRAVDRSEGFVQAVRNRVHDARVQFDVGDAQALHWPAHACDATVSGLVLNFVASPQAMASEMARVTRPGGTVAVYLWDYSGGMQMVRHFWDVAVQLNPHDAKLDQAERFPICQPGPLAALFGEVGLHAVSARAIEVPTVFRDFDDYWTPFLGKQGAAPTYLAGLDPTSRDQIRETLQARLPIAADGSIALTARAWAVRGEVPPS